MISLKRQRTDLEISEYSKSQRLTSRKYGIIGIRISDRREGIAELILKSTIFKVPKGQRYTFIEVRGLNSTKKLIP